MESKLERKRRLGQNADSGEAGGEPKTYDTPAVYVSSEA